MSRHSFHNVSVSRIVKNAYQALAIDELRPIFTPVLWTNEPDRESGQVIEQVWFAGVHSDVGGNTVTGSTIAQPLNWMANNAASNGLEFTVEFTAEVALILELPGSVSSSPPLFWKPAGWGRREIGGTRSGTESIHPSAMEMLENSGNDYLPRNLTRFLATHQQSADTGAEDPAG